MVTTQGSLWGGLDFSAPDAIPITDIDATKWLQISPLFHSDPIFYSYCAENKTKKDSVCVCVYVMASGIIVGALFAREVRKSDTCKTIAIDFLCVHHYLSKSNLKTVLLRHLKNTQEKKSEVHIKICTKPTDFALAHLCLQLGFASVCADSISDRIILDMAVMRAKFYTAAVYFSIVVLTFFMVSKLVY